jgi:hypothetical protein
MGRKAIPIEPYMEKLVQAVAIGATYEMAANFAGISYKTFERWRQRAEDAPDGSPLAVLRMRLLEAEGRAAIGWLARIEAAANGGDWRAAAFKLERKYPETYGRTFNKVAFTDATGERDGALVIKVVYDDAIDVTPEPLRLAAPPDESIG